MIGAAWLQTRAALPRWFVLLLLLTTAVAAGTQVRRLRGSASRVAALTACGMLAGFAWSGLYASRYLAQQLPKEWEGRDVTLIGTVEPAGQLRAGRTFQFRGRARAGSG